MQESKYPGRGIHKEDVFESLQTGKLRLMLNVINDDDDLDVQIRNDYLNIYFKGGNIAKVNSENSVGFDMFYFYLEHDKTPKKDIMKDENIVPGLKAKRDKLISLFKGGDYKQYFSLAKKAMTKWLRIHDKPERMEQHTLSIENQYNKSDYTIIDLEYQVSTKSDFACTFIPAGRTDPKKPRFDIIAVDKQGRLCVIELKKGSKSLEGTSGLEEHWTCYQESIARDPKSFIAEMKQVLKQKKEFSLITNQLEIKDSSLEFMFAYSFDDKTTDEEQNEKFETVYGRIGADIPFIKLARGNFKLLNS